MHHTNRDLYYFKNDGSTLANFISLRIGSLDVIWLIERVRMKNTTLGWDEEEQLSDDKRVVGSIVLDNRLG